MEKILNSPYFPFYCSLTLIVWVGLCAVGLFLGAPPVAMILAAGLGLAGWDGAFEWQRQKAGKLASLDRRHWIAALGAIGGGLALALVGSLIHWQVPFILVVIFTLLALIGMDRLINILRQPRK